MPEIKDNYSLKNKYNTQFLSTTIPANFKTEAPQYDIKAEKKSLKDEFISEHKKNGLFERLYNLAKNVTGLGVGSKKVKEAINKAENNEINEEDAAKLIKDYRKSQVTGAQSMGDIISVGASGLTYFSLRRLLKMKNAEMTINHKYYEELANLTKDIIEEKNKKSAWEKFGKEIIKTGFSKKRLMAVAGTAAAIAGGMTKYWFMNFNRIGSSEFETRKKDYNGAKTKEDKKLYKAAKKQKAKEQRKTNFRNFVSGAVNGLMMPVAMFGGAVAGVPIYLAGNSLNRYFIANREDKKKSLGGYLNNLKNDSVAHVLAAAAIAIPMFKTARFTSIFDKNLEKAVAKLKDAKLTPSEFQGKTTYHELNDIMLNDEKIVASIDKNSIRNQLQREDKNFASLDFNEQKEKIVERQIQNLTNENIFAVKLIQIQDAGALSQGLKESCPTTRTLEKAQEDITKALGDNYIVNKLLGVGTIAETYLTKDPSGNEVVVKLLKEGINEKKILEDKQKTIDIINNLSDKTKEEKEYLVRNIEDLANNIIKETDFENEAKNAKKLVDFTTEAKIVKPLRVENGVYVMEKANDISLESYVKITRCKSDINYYEKRINDLEAGKLYHWEKEMVKKDPKYIKYLIETEKEWLENSKKELKKLKERNPNIANIELNDEDAKFMFEQFMKVQIEQLYKIGKNGKIMHGDPHTGNVMLNLQAVKDRKAKEIFTLIDTGNTIEISPEQAIRTSKLTKFIGRANVPDIVDFMMDGANLQASNYTKEEAVKKVREELTKCFFDNETALEEVSTANLMALVQNIMKKYKIIPSTTQASLDKARTSASTSYSTLLVNWFKETGMKIDKKDSKGGKTLAGIGMLKDYLMLTNKYSKLQAKQDKLNMLLLSPTNALSYKNNPNMLETNSEDYLVYKLKQMYKDATKVKRNND